MSRGFRHWPADAPSTGKSVYSKLSPFDMNRHRRKTGEERPPGATLRPPELFGQHLGPNAADDVDAELEFTADIS